MHIHKIVCFKTFKIAPTCFDPKIIFRDLAKVTFLKHSLIKELISECFKNVTLARNSVDP